MLLIINRALAPFSLPPSIRPDGAAFVQGPIVPSSLPLSLLTWARVKLILLCAGLLSFGSWFIFHRAV